MLKNEDIKIRPISNGYSVEYSYKERSPTANSPDNYEYLYETYMFATWDEVVHYISQKKLEVPPAKI